MSISSKINVNIAARQVSTASFPILLLNEIIETYLVDMDYSVAELSRVLCLTRKETSKIHIDSGRLLQERETRDAIAEAEKILKLHKKDPT